MLRNDVDALRNLIKTEQWDTLKEHHIPGVNVKNSLISFAPYLFTKVGQFANEKKNWLVEQREYVDYFMGWDEVIEVVKKNKKAFLR